MTAEDAQPKRRTPTLTAAQIQEYQHDDEQHRRALLNAVIEEQVLHALGRPEDLFQVQVRGLWEDHFRANVFVGKDAASVKVAHSYFLVTDKDGQIVKSTPSITKKL